MLPRHWRVFCCLFLSSGIQEFPENIKNCKVLAIVEASVNPISKWVCSSPTPSNLAESQISSVTFKYCDITIAVKKICGNHVIHALLLSAFPGSQRASRSFWVWHSSTWTMPSWSSYQPALAGRFSPPSSTNGINCKWIALKASVQYISLGTRNFCTGFFERDTSAVLREAQPSPVLKK